MSTQKAKFELFQRLQNLGFTYDEAVALRRIEMTLHRWAECNGEIERNDETGKPARIFRTHPAVCYGDAPYPQAKEYRYMIADREAGALKRLAAIVKARNDRNGPLPGDSITAHPSFVIPYHQTDPRGCALYLLTRAQLGADKIDEVYTRGLAVCA